jgi:ferredoxin
MQEKIMKDKTLKITLSQSDQRMSYQAVPEENIIESLERQGREVRKACDNGVCGVCLTKLHEGEIDYGLREPFGLNQKELEQGYILPCIAHCKTDIEIDEPPAPRQKRTRP